MITIESTLVRDAGGRLWDVESVDLLGAKFTSGRTVDRKQFGDYETVRDPRINPAPGDVIKGINIGGYGGTCTYTVTEVGETHGEIHVSWMVTGTVRAVTYHLESWRRWTGNQPARYVYLGNNPATILEAESSQASRLSPGSTRTRHGDGSVGADG